MRDGTAGGQLDDGERMGTDGWDHQNRSSLQYRSALVVARMRNIVYSTFDRITSGEVPIRVMAEIL